jgi:hypothetical protein
MDLQALKAELTADPLGRGYSTMSDQEAADSLNAANVAARRLVPLWEVKKLLIESFRWPAIVAGQANAVPEIAAACLSAVAYIDDARFENLDMDILATQAMIGVLVSGGIVSQAEADSLYALASVTTSRSAQLNLPHVGPHHVAAARS